MSTKSKRRGTVANKRDSRKFFTVVGLAVLALMLLMFLIYKGLG
jgi:hypothetical protein